MTGPIPIPDMDTYGLTVLVLFCLAPYTLATSIYSWPLGRRVRLAVLYNILMLVVIAWGALIFDLPRLIGNEWGVLLLSVPLGLLLGQLSSLLDRRILRFIAYRNLGQRRTRPGRAPWLERARQSTVRPVHLMGAARGVSRETTARRNGLPQLLHMSDTESFGLWSIGISAILEETIFRGFLVQACFLLPAPSLIAFGLVVTSLIFSLSHIRFGWQHGISKLPLSFSALLAVVSTGSLVPAMVAHLFFNLRVWKDMQNPPVIVQGAGISGPYHS